MAQLILLAEYSGAQTRRNAGRQHQANPARRSFQTTVPRQRQVPPSIRPVRIPSPGRLTTGLRGVNLKLLDFDLCEPEAVTVTRLRSGQPGKRIDRNDHVLGLHRLCQRNVQVRGGEAVRSHCLGPVN
jgi:hypothetical protein